MDKPVVEFRDLSKIYQTQQGISVQALKEISFTIQKGSIFGIIGMSGAGKSTLIRCLTSLEKPTEGEIFLLGKPLSGLSGEKLRASRREIGLIFQHFNLFSSRTALENVLFPLEIVGDKSKERARELLAVVGLSAKEHLYPSQLSGGEKQRVAIARALANKPQILLGDEATSSLDPRNRETILELLSELNQKFDVTIILITHEMEVVKKICTDVAVLEHGEIVEIGKVTDLFTAPKHPTTQRFLQNLTHELPKDFFPPKEGSEILQLAFRGEVTHQPIISQIVKRYNVDISILLGSVDALKSGLVGHLIIELSGPVTERENAKIYLKGQGVVCHELG